MNVRPFTFFGLDFIAVCEKSMMPKFVVGKELATFSVAAPIRKPLATIRSYFWRASDERFGT